MNKPTYAELVAMLTELATMADDSIPSDNLSNSQLADAEEVIANAWQMINAATN